MGRLDRLQAGQRAAASQTVSGTAFDIWGQRGWASMDVVGESFYGSAIRALFGSARLAADGVELTVPVHLIHNPLNRHDSNAIEVHGSTGLVGHLSREDAARYVPVIDYLQRQGLIAATTARVWGRDQQDWESSKRVFVSSVRIDLPDPHMMLPRNQAPSEAFQLLPSGATIRVSAMDGSAQATTQYVCREGECWVHATLHEVTEQGPRSSKQLTEVRIDGLPVGRLTPKMSSDMLPAVQFLNGRGFTTAVRAVVKGNQLKSEVILHTARAAELPQEWMNAVPAGVVAPVTTAIVMPERGVTVDTAPEDALVQAAAPEPVQAESIVPAAWYPDPQRIARLRWWNGVSWTEHIAP